MIVTEHSTQHSNAHGTHLNVHHIPGYKTTLTKQNGSHTKHDLQPYGTELKSVNKIAENLRTLEN